MIYYCVEVEEKSKHYELRITMVDGMHTVAFFFKKAQTSRHIDDY